MVVNRNLPPRPDGKEPEPVFRGVIRTRLGKPLDPDILDRIGFSPVRKVSILFFLISFAFMTIMAFLLFLAVKEVDF